MVTVLVGILIVGLSIVVAVAGQLTFHHWVPLNVRQKHNDVAGFIYAVLGLVYGVLLAFVVVVVWGQFVEAKDTVDHEANELAAVYQLATHAPEANRLQVQGLIRTYASVVVQEEWPLLASGQASPRAESLISELNEAVWQIEPNSPRTQVLYDQTLTHLGQVDEYRRLRLLGARSSIDPIIWVILIGVGLITITFTYLFGLENNWAHALMIGALTASIVSILILVYELDSPFAGEVRVPLEAFELVLPRLD